MGKKFLVSTAALALALGSVSAHAAVFNIHYTGTTGTLDTASLSITTSDTASINDPSGGFDVTGISGNVNGLTITSLLNNPNLGQRSTSPDGQYYYDNVYFPNADPLVDINGISFFTADGTDWNFYSNGPGNYQLLGALNGAPVGSYAFNSTGAVPEPATWAMLLLGFGMIGFAMRKRSNVRTTVSYA